MKKFLMFLLTLVLAVFLAACGASDDTDTEATDEPQQEETTEGEGAEEADEGEADAGTVEVTHELDPNPVVVKKNPEKVVVFDFGILDTLDALGVDQVVGLPKANVPSYLSKYEDDQYENVGSLKEPDFEAIHALQPDVIFISTRQSDLYEEFAEIAPTVYVGLDTSNYMESFKNNMNIVAEIFDKKDEVNEAIENIEAKIAEIHEKASALDETTLIVLGTEGKISAYGPGSRFGLIHDVLGFKPADEQIEASTHGQNISFEYILEKNPGILFVIDRDAAISEESSVKETLENDLVQKTDAYQNGKIIYLNPEYWYLSGGGLISVQEMIQEVATAL